MELGFKIVKYALVWAGFCAHRKRGLVQSQIIERVVYSNTLSINWLLYYSKGNSNSYLVSLIKHHKSKYEAFKVYKVLKIDDLSVILADLKRLFDIRV